MKCSCCGEDRQKLAALPSHEDVQLCHVCVGWLARKLGVESTPTLPVIDLDEAVAFNERAGFGVRIYKGENGDSDGFAFVDFDGQSVFDRAHSVGHERRLLNLLGYALMVNGLALHRHRRREPTAVAA